jgi:hypothetical protein
MHRIEALIGKLIYIVDKLLSLLVVENLLAFILVFLRALYSAMMP